MAAKWQQWMPLHIDRFMGSPSVRAMHPAAQMGYLYLLMVQWQSEDCSLSPATLDLAEQSGLGDELWAIHGPRILRKFEALPNGRLRNSVCFNEWTEARAIYEKRKGSAEKTNALRTVTAPEGNGHRAPTVYGPVSVNVPVDVSVDSVDTRILAESVGIFEMRQQADMHRLLAVHMKDSGRNVGEAIAWMVGQWEKYQKAMPDLEWQYGSAYKFFMSGNWDDPRVWPRKDGNSPPNPGAQQTVDSPQERRLIWESMSDKFKQENPWVGV